MTVSAAGVLDDSPFTFTSRPKPTPEFMTSGPLGSPPHAANPAANTAEARPRFEIRGTSNPVFQGHRSRGRVGKPHMPNELDQAGRPALSLQNDLRGLNPVIANPEPAIPVPSDPSGNTRASDPCFRRARARCKDCRSRNYLEAGRISAGSVSGGSSGHNDAPPRSTAPMGRAWAGWSRGRRCQARPGPPWRSPTSV